MQSLLLEGPWEMDLPEPTIPIPACLFPVHAERLRRCAAAYKNVTCLPTELAE